MSLRDELNGATNRVALLRQFIETSPDRDEWLEIMRRGDLYSLQPVLDLLASRGHHTVESSLHRFRASLEGYVASR